MAVGIAAGLPSPSRSPRPRAFHGVEAVRRELFFGGHTFAPSASCPWPARRGHRHAHRSRGLRERGRSDRNRDGAHRREQLFRLGIVEQQGDAGAGVDAKVIAALGTDPQVAIEVPRGDDLLAPLALDPQSLGYGAAGPIHADRLGLLRLSEPGHERASVA